MRYLPDVIMSIINEIPIQVENKKLMENLMSIRSSSMYASPEMMPVFFCEVAQELEVFLPDPNNLSEWQKKIVNIWMDVK